MKKIVVMIILCLLLFASVGTLGLSCDDEEEEPGVITAKFDASPKSGEPPLAVEFTDQSEAEGGITSWAWEFGDGETSTAQNPTHTYEDLGEYTVSLTVSGPDGSDTETKAAYIEVKYEIEVSWRVTTYSSVGDARTLALEKFAEELFDISLGRMELNIFAGETLYSAAESIDALSNGLVELAYFPDQYAFGRAPRGALSAASLLYSNTAEHVAYNKVFRALPECQAEMAENNWMPVFYLDAGGLEAFFDSPVTEMDDINGMMMRSFGGIGDGWVQMLGASPVVMTSPEIYLAAETGLIDGSFGPFNDYVKLKFYEVLPYLVILGFMPGTSPLFVHTPSYEALPQYLQDALWEAAEIAEPYGINLVTEQRAELEQELVDNPDVNVHYLTAAESDNWRLTAFVPVVAAAIKSYFGEDWYNELVAIAEDLGFTVS